MKTFANIFIAICMGLLLTSCEDVIELDVPESRPQLVVEGSITNTEGRQRIKLSWSTPYFEESTPPPVVNAQVRLIDNVNRNELLQEEVTGTFFTDISGKIGNSYSITITLEDGRIYRSDPETLFPVTQIDHIKVVREDPEEELDEEGKAGYKVLITAFVPPEERNFYRWKIYVNDTLENKPDDLAFARDDFVNEQVIDVEIFSDYMRQGDSVRVEQMSITESYYDFLSVLFQQTVFTGGLFDPPPAPIDGNIRNLADEQDYALGYFHASAVVQARTKIED
ncbi:MAG: DUF4249 domain-containing protein [Bacteroidota bacterium]